MEKHYGRAQFLRDAVSLGLPTHLAFSRNALRRQRDRLILQHHPDRGGSAAKAWEINEIYSRMVKWRDERYRPGELIDEPKAEENRAKHENALRQTATIALWAAVLVTSGYVALARMTRR
jgi:hypothetical protein